MPRRTDNPKEILSIRIDPAVRRVILDIVNTSKNAGETLTTAAERLIKNSPEFKKAASKAGATA